MTELLTRYGMTNIEKRAGMPPRPSERKMNTSYVWPERGKTPFHCPHCNVMSQHNWLPLFWKEGLFHQTPPRQGSDEDPPPIRHKASVGKISASDTHGKPSDEKERKKHPIATLAFDNANMLRISECQNCKEVSIWLFEQMIYPDGYAPPPNPDLIEEIAKDYLEARSIVNKSPRGAAALLRLCIEKLCVQLGGKGKGINEQIGYLVREKNLDQRIQQSLDVVRVVGNESVHPGTMDLRDDNETAMILFRLINLIADTMVTQPKQIQEMYDKLPDGKKKGIENRDKRK